MKFPRAWAIIGKDFIWVSFNYKKIKRDWDGWFKQDERFNFEEVEIRIKKK